MPPEFKNLPRPVIPEFAKEINASKTKISNSKTIPFRDDKIVNKVRDAYKVPVQLLRFRKDNGRISSDVITYENSKGTLVEATDHAQTILKRFLIQKDPKPTTDLSNSILKEGQEEPAVITADGFLINGNRRKMVFESLLEKYPGDERFKYLKVIILPGRDDNEALPTPLELEQLENRFQFQKTGFAEYYNFDMALSIRRKEEMGMSLEEQLRDDPNFSTLPESKFRKKLKDFQDDYLKPLECIDKYLEYLNRPGHYNTVSEGRGDAEGRWQAFLDYYNIVYKKLLNPKSRVELGIQDGDEGKIENVAFKIIRQREIKGLDKKAHQIMRDLPKLLKNQFAKKELFKLVNIGFDLPHEEVTNELGEPVDEKTKDIIWSNKNASALIHHVRKAFEFVEQSQESENPMNLLKAALEKLNHPKMDISAIIEDNQNEAMKLTRAIQVRANDLEHQIYDAKRNKEKLIEKHNKKKRK